MAVPVVAAPIYLLRVFTFGLIAYVASGSDDIRHLRVLLIDATHSITSTDGCPIRKHEPLLIYDPKTRPCEIWCRAESGVCACPLEREAIALDDQLAAPGSKFDRGEFDRYVPVLQDSFNSNQKMREQAVRPPKPWIREVAADCLFKNKYIRVCPFVAAEASLRPEQTYACEMATGIDHHYGLPKKGDRWQEGQEFNFRSLSQGEFEVMRKQNVATKLAFVSQVDAGQVLNHRYLDVAIRRFDGTRPPRTIRLVRSRCPVDACWENTCAPNLDCFDLAIANVPVHADQNLLYGRCQAHGIDRDFELLEDLVTNQQDLEDREVPFDRRSSPPVGMVRAALCDSSLVEDFNRWLRTDQATSECSGGRIRN